MRRKITLFFLMMCLMALATGCGRYSTSVEDLTGAESQMAQVEKSNLASDNAVLTSIAQNLKLACADEELAGSGLEGYTLYVAGQAGSDKSITFNRSNALERELADALGDSVTTTSNTYKASIDPIVFTIVKDSLGYRVTVTGMYDRVGDTTSSEKTF